MAKTIVGLYDTQSEAGSVVEDLVDSGFDRDRISMVASDREGQYAVAGEERRGHEGTEAGKGAATGAVTGGVLGALAGILAGIGTLVIPGIGTAVAAGPILAGLIGAGVGAAGGGLLGALVGLGVSEDEAGHYAEAVRRGGTLVTVSALDHEVDQIVDIMNRHNPVDIEERAEDWRREGWTGYEPEAEPYTTAGTLTEERERYAARETTGTTKGTIPVVEEDIQVGKRKVERGGVRVRTYIVEEPVEKDVRLREERVHLERHPVDRPVTPEDVEPFREATFEVTETGEEAVVRKQARVVEEISAKKDIEERTERVSDTVRHTEVDVEEVGTEYARGDIEELSPMDLDYFRQHYNTTYAARGDAYEDYDPAYRYGYGLARDKRYRDRREWKDIEPEARRRWEAEHKGRGTWDKAKDAVRHAWDRAKKSS